MKLAVDGRFFSDARVLSRGQGRWALDQAGALLRYEPGIEVSILVRPDGREACRRLVPGARVVSYPEELSVRIHPPVDRATRLSRDAETSGWLLDLQLDAFLDTTPFLPGSEPLPPFPGPLPTIACVHDLLPFALGSPRLRSGGANDGLWGSGVDRLRFADSLLVSSEFVRRHATSILGIPGDRVIVGYPVPAAAFGSQPAEDPVRALARIGITAPPAMEFVLALPATRREEDLRTLLSAWASLPRGFRDRRFLLLRGAAAPWHSARLAAWIRSAGLEGEVVHAGLPADEDLAALYASAWAYVHMPRHEGFATSVVEAMACGAVVVAPAAASLAEAAEQRGLLVETAEPESLRYALLRLDRDPDLLEDLRAKASASRSRFSGRVLGDAVLRAVEAARTARRVRRRSERPMRFGIVTPVPPQPSGVADYSAELAAGLGRHAEVELFVDRGVAPLPSLRAWPVHDVRRLVERSRDPGFDVVLHQMGASSFHLFVERTLRDVPGIVTLHDLLWGRVLYHLRGGAEGLADLETRMRRLEGATAVSEFHRLLATAGPALNEKLDEFFARYPLIDDVVRGSRGVVVHFPEGARRVRERFPGIPVRWFPMGVADPLRPGVRTPADVRARYGLPPAGYLVGAFGIADPVKRLDVVVRAVAELAPGKAGAGLAIVGRFTSDPYRAEVEGLASGLGVAERVHVVDSPPIGEFEALLGACDAVVNLRYPSHLQMSATLVRAMAAGKPVVATDLPEWRFLPEDACERVPAGVGEVERVRDVLSRWQMDPEERRRRGAFGRRWFLENATIEAMSANYIDFARELA